LIKRTIAQLDVAPTLVANPYLPSRLLLDYSSGFGGKYGVQQDSQDKSAVGWDYKEKLAQHESQKGNTL